MTRTFFDVLSTDELSVVVRFLSDNARSDSWLSGVSRGVRKLLFLRGSAFIRVVPIVLKCVRINCVAEGVNSMNFFADDPLLIDVIERHGGYIEHLRIVEHERVIRKLTESIYNRLIARCTGITRISFWFRGYSVKKVHHKRLLLAVQGNLRELTVKYEVPFCGDMVQRFSGCEFPVLRRLEVDGPQVDGILDKLLSRQLVEVEVQSWFSDWAVISRQLRDKCPDLTALLLKGILEDLHVPLLSSYGKQLVRANLQWLSIVACRKVIAACPKVASHLNIDWTYVPRLRLLANHVSKVVLDPVEINSPHDLELLKDTSARCTQLEAVTCVSNIADTRVLDSLFEHKKPALEYMRIAMRRATFSTAQFVYTTGNLREADLLVGKFSDINTLTKLIAANNHLHTLKIAQVKKINEKVAHATARKILVAVRTHLNDIKWIQIHLPVLVDPECSNYRDQRVSNACSFFRLRQVVVHITPPSVFS